MFYKHNCILVKPKQCSTNSNPKDSNIACISSIMEVARSCLYLFSLHMFCTNELDATQSTRIDSHNTAKKTQLIFIEPKKARKWNPSRA